MFSQKKSLLGSLLVYRLRWYTLVTGNQVMRYFQAIALLVVFLASVIDYSTLALPVLTVLRPDGSVFRRLAVIVAAQAVGVVWLLPQGESVKGGACAQYMRTCPLNPWLRWLTDLVVMLVASFPLMVPFLVAEIVLCQKAASVIALIAGSAGTCGFLALLVAAQAAWIGKRAHLIAALLGTDLLLAAGGGFAVPGVTLLFYAGVIVSGLYLLSPLPGGGRKTNALYRLHLTKKALGRALAGGVIWPGLLVEVKFLFSDNLSHTLLRFGWAFSLQLFALWVAFNAQQGETIYVVLAFITNFTAFIFCGFYRPLHEIHRAAASYLRTLPLRGSYWPLRDLATVTGLAFVPVASITLVVYLQHLITVFQSLTLLAFFLVLMPLLRPVQLFAGRYATLVGFGTSIIATLLPIYIGLKY